MYFVLGGLAKALDDIEKLILDLSNVDKINMTKLEDAEKRFKAADETILAGLDKEVEKSKKVLESQDTVISNYELDLEPLRKQIKHVNDIFDAIPRVCLKAPAKLEIG